MSLSKHKTPATQIPFEAEISTRPYWCRFHERRTGHWQGTWLRVYLQFRKPCTVYNLEDMIKLLLESSFVRRCATRCLKGWASRDGGAEEGLVADDKGGHWHGYTRSIPISLFSLSDQITHDLALDNVQVSFHQFSTVLGVGFHCC